MYRWMFEPAGLIFRLELSSKSITAEPGCKPFFLS